LKFTQKKSFVKQSLVRPHLNPLLLFDFVEWQFKTKIKYFNFFPEFGRIFLNEQIETFLCFSSPSMLKRAGFKCNIINLKINFYFVTAGAMTIV